jgi:hypothetical protein
MTVSDAYTSPVILERYRLEEHEQPVGFDTLVVGTETCEL